LTARRLAAACAAACITAASAADPASLLEPLALPGAGTPWRDALLPAQTLPRTTFEIVQQDGRRALQIVARGAYGNLAHPLPPTTTAPLVLAWRWRVDRFVAASDLARKSGDDAAVKVCVAFDMPDARVPFIERQLLRIARASSDEPLPAATLCYVWDRLLAKGTRIDNAYTRRVRYLVLQGAPLETGVWESERRDLGADFLLAFGDESDQVPPLAAVLVGADADNTQGESKSFIADLTLTR